MKNNIDMHIHSTASDGSFKPIEIVEKAKEIGLSAISITDHDTLDGNLELLKQKKSIGDLKFVTGIEISAELPKDFEGSGTLHLLGYFIDLDNKDLNSSLDFLKEKRKKRAAIIIDTLKKQNIKISYDEVLDIAQDELIARPHIAEILFRKGYVSSHKEAFNKFLSKGGLAYIKREKIHCEKAIELIKKANGISSFAHPIILKVSYKNFSSEKSLEEFLIYLKSIGLNGIESYYSTHTYSYFNLCHNLSKKYDLVETGGSDFHGSFKKKIKMGSGFGNLNVPYKVYEQMLNAKNKLEKT